MQQVGDRQGLAIPFRPLTLSPVKKFTELQAHGGPVVRSGFFWWRVGSG
jgi:hypothetical protein